MANGAPISLTPQFQRFGIAPQAQPQQRRGGGNIPLALALGAAGQGLLQGGQRGGLGTALLGATSAAIPAFIGGQQMLFDRQAAEDERQAAAQQQALENLRAQQKDQREAQDIAFKQNNAVQQLQLNQAKFRLDQATSAPDKIQVLQAMGLDPASPEGRELLTASLTKPQVQINQPKLSPGQIPIDPNDLSKGSVAAKDIGQARVTAANVGATLDRYQQALQESGAETLPGPARDKLKNARTQLLLELKTLNELGAITGPDLDLMNDLVIDPTSFNARVGNAFGALAGNSLGERALANIDVLRQQVSDRLNAITGQVGAPAVPQAAQQATPSDLSQMSTEQLLQLQGSLSAGNP